MQAGGTQAGAEDAIPTETLLQAVAQWHSLKDKEHSHLQLVELQFKSLREAMLGRSKHGQWQGLRRRAQFAEEECFPLIQQAEGYLRDLERSLLATERECSKRMERIERDCLHRDIQIQGLLDQQILSIVQENKALEMGEEDVKPFLIACKALEERVAQERKEQQDFLLNCRIQLEEFKSDAGRRIKDAKKAHQAKMLVLRQKLAETEKKYAQKISNLRQKREAFENRLLQHIERQIAHR